MSNAKRMTNTRMTNNPECHSSTPLGAVWRAWLITVPLLLCVVALRVQADTITVINTNDSGPGSLRQALADANVGDTITFAVGGAIGLTGGELLVDKDVTISGPGADNLAIDGGAKSRVFHVSPRTTATISALTVRNGLATGDYPDDSVNGSNL
jgi:hypothetical protein